MLQISPNNIVPISEIKNKLNSLADSLDTNLLVVSKNGRATKLGLINLDYLEKLQEKSDQSEMGKIEQDLRKDFRVYLKDLGYDPDKLTDEDIYRIIDKI